MGSLRTVVVLGLLLLPLVACGQSPEGLRPAIEARYPQVRWVSPDVLERWMSERRPLVLLDARAPREYGVSHLRGATRVDPDGVDARAIHVPDGARVVVYCSVGWRSAGVASEILRARGIRAFNLEGGIFAWANRGRSLYRGDTEVERVHPFDRTWGRLLERRFHAYH